MVCGLHKSVDRDPGREESEPRDTGVRESSRAFTSTNFIESGDVEPPGYEGTKNRRALGPPHSGDLLIVSELSRTGRSVIEIISIVNSLIRTHVRFVAIKEGFDIKGDHDIQTKVLVTIFSLLAELERDLISERTRQALAAKKAQGVKLGTP